MAQEQNTNIDDIERVERRMQNTNPFSNNTPPPIPPKPKKFSKQNRTQQTGFSGKPAMIPPLSTVSTSLTEEGNSPHKRKLTINIPMSQSVLPDNYHSNGDGVSVSKSPKVVTPGQNRIWSPIICTICMEDLFSYEEVKLNAVPNYASANESGDGVTASNNITRHILQPETLRPTVTTRCGHLFHTECINKWFIGNKEKELKECPFCKREMMANDTTRIFPIFEDD